ncbi:hypothetical protein [Actinophytocola oryzae]|uniref:hypothetical protein n=1 Tax=Actinophytocola oryzae TaxID=502181 RepID=UPI00106371F9|nr:hypothetical protein [Actinophytocola oryzae]
MVTMTWPRLDWPYPVWEQTSAQFHQQFMWTGPIAATAACWCSIARHSKGPIPAVTRDLAQLVGWFAGAYLLALSPLAVSTVINNGIGTPDPLAMLSGVLAMCAATALGYAVGAVARSMAAAPTVAAGFCTLLVLANATRGGYVTAIPVLPLEPLFGQQESLPLVVFRIALFIMITITAAGLAARSRSHRDIEPGRSRRAIRDIATYATAPVVMVTLSMIHQPVMFNVDQKPPMSCMERRDIRYCVHADNQSRLIDLVHAVDPIIVRYGTKPVSLNQIWDQALTFHPIDAGLARGLEVAWLNPDGTIHTQVPENLAGVNACDNSQRRGEELKKMSNVAADFSDYLLTGRLSGTLSAMSSTTVRQWITQHYKQLNTCTLTLDQLP